VEEQEITEEETPVSEETPESGGEETPQYDPEEIERLRAENEALRGFESHMNVMMDVNASNLDKKNSARAVLLGQLEQQEQPQMTDDNDDVFGALDFEDPQARRKAQELEEQILQMRARNLKESMENRLSSAISSNADLKVLNEWIESARQGEDLSSVRSSISENVRRNALENLRKRRDMEGSFNEDWLDEAIQQAASKVAKDMLTVIGDTSKIGRVPETAGQTETLSRRKPVELPNTKGKSFGDVEAQLRDWTTDQILRSLSDPGGDSKA
jgi:hypothetical protein